MTEQADIDVGKQFANFMVHRSERHALGVRCIRTDPVDDRCPNPEFCFIWRWNRLHFGGKGSPYFTNQGQTIIIDDVKGNRRDTNNPSHWDRVHLNMPTSEQYNCSLPTVLKLRVACGRRHSWGRSGHLHQANADAEPVLGRLWPNCSRNQPPRRNQADI